MRSPNNVLDSLANQSTREEYKFERIYRNLYNLEFYLMAYAKITEKGNYLTQQVDGTPLNNKYRKRIERLIECMKDCSYQPKPPKKVSHFKGKGPNRTTSIPTFEDLLVQEVVRTLLESMYEKTFSINSHGFRQEKSCHTALKQVKDSFHDARWFVEIGSKGSLENIDHHKIIELLKKRINDEKFINLIWKLLKAGFLVEWGNLNRYSGTPQGGNIGTILSNIYLHELDNFIRTYNEQFKVTETYNKIQYVRYGYEMIIGFSGSKEDCRKIQSNISNFLNEELKINLSQAETRILHSSTSTRFLGYDIRVGHANNTAMATASGHKHSTRTIRCDLLIPHEIWRNKLIEYNALVIDDKTNKWKSMHRTYLLQKEDLEILTIYKNEIRDMYDYYRFANNVKCLGSFKYIMEYSMYKTFANKYKSSVRKIIRKYSVNGRFAIKSKTVNTSEIVYFDR